MCGAIGGMLGKGNRRIRRSNVVSIKDLRNHIISDIIR
jgi:hypothetical protein